MKWIPLDRKQFSDQNDYEKHMELARCAVCFKRFKDGDEIEICALPVYLGKSNRDVTMHKICAEGKS
jgi:hypothetical protein